MSAMRCDEALETVAVRAAGEDEPSSRDALEGHLKSCVACRLESGRILAALTVLKQEDGADPGPAYWAAFGSRLRTRIARHRARTRTLVALAAAALLVVSAGLAGLRPGSPPQRRAGGPRGEEALTTGDPAEARLEALLKRSASDAEGRLALQRVLDELAPADPLVLEQALGSMSSEEAQDLYDEYPGC